MKQDDVKKLSAAMAARAARLAKMPRKAAQVARPAAPAKPAPVAPEPTKIASARRRKPQLRVISGDVLPPQKEAAPALPAPKGRLKVSQTTLERARVKRRQQEQAPAVNPFSAYQPPKGVLPEGTKIAMDENIPGVSWAGQAFVQAASFASVPFLGYPILAEMAQRPEYRKISERLATEMTKKWIKLKSTSSNDDDKSEKIKELEEYLLNLKLRECAEKLARLDGLFGRSHLYLDIDGERDPAELKTPIGNGRDDLSRAKIKKGSLRRLQVVEAVWCYPSNYNAIDPLSEHWFDPERWFCMAKEIHKSRLMTFIGRPVPDLLKPAYAFGGLSLTQMAKPYVDRWIRTVNSVSDLVSNFSKNGIKTDMQQQLSPAAATPGGGLGDGGSSGDDFFRRLELWTQLSDNQGLLVLDKNNEEFFQFNTPLGTLDQLQAQSQEQLCSVAGIPVVVLLGLTPHGLNASSEGEIRAWESWVEAYQKFFYGDRLRSVIDIAQISLWGAVDPDIVYEWEPLRSMTEKDEADIQKAKADTDKGYIEAGVLDPIEVRRKIANDPRSGYNDIDVEDVPEPPEDPEAGLGGGEGEEDDLGEPGASNVDPEEAAADGSAPFATDEFVESEHPRDPGGKFTSGVGSSGGSTASTAAKSKKSLIGELLTKGTTAQEVLKATGWPSVSMPAQAHAAGMKLVKYQEGGVTKYKGTPYTPEEKAAVEAEIKAKKAAKKAAAAAAPAAAPASSALGEPKVIPANTEAKPEPVAKITSESDPSMEVHIFKNTQHHGKFNVLLHDKDSGQNLDTVKIVNSFGEAQTAGQEMLHGPANMPKPSPQQIQTAMSKNPLGKHILPHISDQDMAAFNAKWSGANAPKTEAQAIEKVAAFNKLKAKNDIEGAKASAAAKLKAEQAAKKEMAAIEAQTSPEEIEQIKAFSGATGVHVSAVMSGWLAAAKNKIQTQKLKMSEIECASIIAYSGSHYRGVNAGLRAGKLTPDQHKFVKTLDAALSKLPSYTAPTRRGADLNVEQQKLYTLGMVIQERAFSSTSKGSGFGGNTNYVFTGTSGRDISKISSHPSEQEVLYPSNTWFRVSKVEGTPGGKMTVHLEEI